MSAADDDRTLLVWSDAPESFEARARWVFETLLTPCGRRLALTRDTARLPGCALAYASVPQPGVPTIPCSAAALELLAAGRPLPPGSFVRLITAAGELTGAWPAAASAAPAAGADAAAFAAPFDLVASAFVLLACWDEHTHGERDRFGRLPYGASVFAENQALDIADPAVDGCVRLLRVLLGPRLAALGRAPLPAPGWLWSNGVTSAPLTNGGVTGDGASPARVSAGGPRFAVALTHDVDNLWRWTPRGFAAAGYRSARALRHGDVAALRRELGDVVTWLTHHLPRRSDPYWTFPQLLAGEDERGLPSTFFVIARHTHRQDGVQPRTYTRRIPAALTLLARHGREIGLHGNDADRLGVDALTGDRDLLARRAGCSVGGVRYHYLRCLYHETLPLLERAGLSYDSSLAFAEREGFRCGCSWPFRPYSLAEERPLDLIELPLALMDSGLQGAQYRALDGQAAERVSVALLERVAANGGAVAVLWHNNRFDHRSAQGYDDVYWRLLDWIAAHDGLATTAGDIVARYRAAAGMGAAAPPSTPAAKADAAPADTGPAPEAGV